MNDKDHLVGKLTRLSTKDPKDEHKQSNRQVWDIFKRMSVQEVYRDAKRRGILKLYYCGPVNAGHKR